MDSKLFKCPVPDCNISYTKECRLKVHIRKHTGERPFVCDVPQCNKSYTNAAHLKRHKCCVHEKSEEILCNIDNCNQVLSNRYALKKHQNIKHNEANYSFRCSECSQGFQRKKQLQMHSYLHTGKMPYKCNTCDMKFSSNRDCNAHQKQHDIFYSCKCGEEFKRWTKLCEHKRTTCVKKDQHKCIICEKAFSRKENLKLHSLTHVEESQKSVYKCWYENCTRSYYHKKNLTYHINTFHKKLTEKIRFKCTQNGCNATLKTRQNLKQHFKLVHNKIKKKNVKRKPRRDKGIPKVPMASVLTGVKLSGPDNLQLVVKLSKIVPEKINEITNPENSFEETNEICKKNTTAEINWHKPYLKDDLNNIDAISDKQLLEKCDEVLRNLQEYAEKNNEPPQNDRNINVLYY